MIDITNVEVIGWEHAIHGMRNPMNSWDKSDTDYGLIGNFVDIGFADYELMMKLRNAGTDHRKFMRMIVVYLDINAPLYWWKEFDTYKVGTVVNSCSTMHKIHAKEFTMDDFSHDHLLTEWKNTEELVDYGGEYLNTATDVLAFVIHALNTYRDLYVETKDKRYWQQIIQLLPSSYNQKRTVMLNYEVLANIYKARKNHKLDEWREFCKWIEKLPYSELITGERNNED